MSLPTGRVRSTASSNTIIIFIGLITVFGLVSANMDGVPQAAYRIKDEPESVWVEFIQLALDHKPLNLGQGFPDFAASQYLLDSLKNATNGQEDSQILANQYTRSFGHPRLVKALADYYKRFRHFMQIDNPNEQFLVTVGAYEALFVSIMAFVNPGDEVLLVDPAFDAYAPIVGMAQGKTVFVPLRLNTTTSGANKATGLSSAHFALDMDEFEDKINNRTRLLVLNTPNNPLGKMYSIHELESIAKLCIKHNILVIADEVYEQMYYHPYDHVSIASLPGMWERTITIGSAGKTFSVTGWKIGWAFGPKHLIRYAQLVHQTAIYTVATPLQEAIARALEREMHIIESNSHAGKFDDYWTQLRRDLVHKRDQMADILRRANMTPVVPQGGYFMLADFSSLASSFPEYKLEGISPGRPESNDYLFARWMSRSKKLQGIPASAFYSAANKHLASNLIRFCFIKRETTLSRLEVLIANFTSDVDETAPQTRSLGAKSKL